jgi:DNA-binding winged helix-turn-helix (wHTH) protein
MRVSFGDVTVDTGTRQLFRDAREIHVSPKAFELLAILIEHRPRALSKDQLHDRLWPDTYVSESNLAGLVAEIRRAVGDDARQPRLVRTVSRFGYAFAGETTPEVDRAVDSGPSCCVICGDHVMRLVAGENILGRDADAGGFDSITVSRRHARIVVAGARATLEDLGSKNGTYLWGKKVVSPQELADGDEIGLGSLVVKFRRASTDDSTQTWPG